MERKKLMIFLCSILIIFIITTITGCADLKPSDAETTSPSVSLRTPKHSSNTDNFSDEYKEDILVQMITTYDISMSATSGDVSILDMKAYTDSEDERKQWEDDRTIWWKMSAQGGMLQLDFDVEQSGTYKIMAAFTKGPDYGKFLFYIDNNTEPVQNGIVFNFCDVEAFQNGNYDYVNTGEILINNVVLKKGSHTLRAEMVGTDGSGYKLGLNYIALYN